jgi:hypothetical protein
MQCGGTGQTRLAVGAGNEMLRSVVLSGVSAEQNAEPRAGENVAPD